MDSMDDDFGDLYADVEVQVKSTFNNAPEFTKLYREPEPQDDNKNNKNANLKSNLVSEPTQKASSFEGDDGSDSEDDLTIVLNDEDCKRSPVNNGGGGDENEDCSDQIRSNRSELNANTNGHGYNLQYSQYKYIRSHGTTLPSNSRVNGSAKGDWEDNVFNQHKGSNSGQLANIRAGCMANSVVPQSVHGFSLPWYRTILDVNIDTFQEKPWSHPGANISDFFNFDLNEDTWKRYCNFLDEYRDCTFMQGRYPVYEPSKLNQAYEVGSKPEKVDQVARFEDIIRIGSSSKYFDKRERPLELPKGRAIEVEGGTGERQPSMDVRRPRYRDTDVVIQINVQDSAEDFSGSAQEEVGHVDSNSSDRETAKNGNLKLDHKRDVHHCRSASEDELSTDSVGKDARTSCMDPALRRCSEPLGADGHANGKISDSDEYHHRKVNVCTSEGTPEAMESLNKAEELVRGRNTCKSDSCLMETEALGEPYYCSTSPSFSGSDSELSKDGIHGDPVKICTLLRRSSPNSGTELKDSVTSNHKKSISNDFKTTGSSRKYYLRYRSPCQQDWKSHNWRHHGVMEQKSYPESDDDASPISNKKGDGKYCYLRCGILKEKWKHCCGVICSDSEQNIHPENGDKTSKMSDAEDLCDREYRSVDRSRQNGRLCYFDYHDTEDCSYYRKTGLSFGCGRERFGDSHARAVHKKHPHGRYHPSFRDQMDPYVRRKWDEKGYFHGGRARVDSDDDMDRDCYHHKRGACAEEMIPESRWLVPKYCSIFKESGTKWRSKSDKLQFENKIDHDGDFLDYSLEDEVVLEKCGRSVSFTEREKDFLDGKYERGFPFTGREERIPVKGGRCGNSSRLYLNRSGPIEVENVCWRCMDHQSLISESYRECYTTNKGRLHDTMSSTDDVYGLKLTERYGQRRRHICNEEHRDNDWLGICTDNDDTRDSIMDHNNQIYLGRRTSWQSKELPRMEDELIARDQDNEFFAEKASFSYKEISMHEKIHAKYESDYEGILIDDMQAENHRYKFISERRSTKCVNRNYDVFNRGQRDNTFLRCRDSVDLVIGERKSSGGQSTGRSFICNDRFERMDMKLANEQTSSKDFHKSNKGKAVRNDILKIESNKNSEKWLDKYQITEHNEDLDVEEGQMVMEGPDMENLLEKKDVSQNKVPTLKKRISCSENASNENNDVRDYDKQHILETIAKMEKRRERFKDPITLKKKPDNNLNPQANFMVDTSAKKQKRPARKRRWDES